MRHTVTNRAPEYHVSDTDWGTSYGAYRLEENGSMSWRIANFVFPFWTQAPNSDFLTNVGVRAWVPMDDEHTMVVLISWKKSPGAYTGMPLKNGKAIPGLLPTLITCPIPMIGMADGVQLPDGKTTMKLIVMLNVKI